MIYYSGDIWGADGSVISKPNMMVNIPWDDSYPWRLSGVSAKLPNGDIFTVKINPSIKDPFWAGIATHTYNEVPLICYSFHKDYLYQLDDGKWCTSAYVCNHHGPPIFDTKPDPSPAPQPPPPPAPAPEGTLITTIASNQIFIGIYAQTASTVFGHLRSQIGNNRKDCKETAVRLNSRCEIRFRCHTIGEAVALDDMANFLINEMPQLPGFASYEEVTYDGICKKFDTRPGHEGECIAYTEKIDSYLVVPKSLDIEVETVFPSGPGTPYKVESTLGYEITCAKSIECSICKAVKFIESPVGVLPSLVKPVSCEGLCREGVPNCPLCDVMARATPAVAPWGGKVFKVDCGASC
jgi:hypothetical protein